ncbi:MAG: hypothetical protein ACD_57C00364G0002 [uncultured bacterium]|uniref:Uncharacterized protein n=1 Tax=Candidatus Woesebacteria bacterium RIFCSPHIGHO2_12_FULL_41_24 TaxID=1802510 RepID=A0A1F8AQT9_9BACT|nr:MAG: hypothetical protein ACD_57C00364G0002 [uncultured bacterium]OGM13422.1 MAG: hypothetical protein A2W15_06005 [Candidatus Woesebacteria bacterium RBG_16_41_13]OGM29827.1 MAG: hypothetical protein A2873_04280 [Candidatus Woesebacteria bacterium RIFCSPHIGHO2_01_FULL_42_80]OGM35966.1 MAG: hypothetical protein A3D84_01795 [Candidatus Woesebacteria bacterium RIFCSPHIGHO2_02_FULL_42_20]OGM54142.1 MAG: hypothetical protein A3E44_00465 [Candidatus Woesebacteria bacterium RIFCSPHIGHO2_12_FULL_41
MTVEQEKALIATIDRLPKLSPEQEKALIKVCIQGQVLPLSELNIGQPFYRPPVIEITGMPKTFKTSFLKTYALFCAKKGIPVKVIPEPVAPFGRDQSPTAYNLVLAQRAADLLLTEQLSEGNGTALTLIDRGIYNEIPFLEVYADEEEIDHEDAEIASRYFTRFFGGFIDAVVICKASPQVSLSRENLRAANPDGRIMNIQTLGRLRSKFDDLPNRIAALRNETLLRNTPILIAELDSEQPATLYKGNMMRTIGSLTKICTSVIY